MMRKGILIAILLTLSSLAFGQLYPERRDVRRGNRAYERGNYGEAEERYMEALAENPAAVEAHFNLGATRYRQGRFEEAEQRFGTLGQVPAPPEILSQIFYNQGNSQVSHYRQTYDRDKLRQALEVYKQSLRLNPDDQQAKFNLAYVQKLLENENDGGGGGGGGGGDQDSNPPPAAPPPPQAGPMTRQEAEQLLGAVQNSEDRTRERLEERQAAPVGRSGKNW